jgi:hypothetical protein
MLGVMEACGEVSDVASEEASDEGEASEEEDFSLSLRGRVVV